MFRELISGYRFAKSPDVGNSTGATACVAVALRIAVVFAATAVLLPAAAAQLSQLSERSAPDTSGKRPASGPKNTHDSASAFEVLDGFEMQLVAAEPNVREPILISYDEDGRLYVAEFLKFPATGGKSDGPDGRVRLLHDRDGDGYYEDAQIFADGLAWPTGICPWNGGIFVIAVPDLWYLKDTDGDGRADVRRRIYTGFGFRNEEGTANNLVWWLDGWIYGAGSNSGGDVVRVGDEHGRSVSLRGQDFRFHPVTLEFEAISGSEQFGNTFDDWGNRFLCQNSKPVVQVVLPSHYLARNPYLPVPSVLQNAWNDGNTVFRASPIETWRQERTKMRLQERPDWTGPSIEHDVFTACTGVTIYRGGAYPQKYRGNLFVGDVQSNLIHRRTVNSEGTAVVTRRADDKTEMVRSRDNWFRPANLLNAPDGTLHVVDMYREVIETPDSLPESILAKLDLQAGHDRGRIYRLAPAEFHAPPPPQFSTKSTRELVAILKNPNGWQRDTAARLLQQRRDPDAVDLLRTLLKTTASDLTQLHALYALSNQNALTADDVQTGLQSSSPRVREHAVRLSETILRSAESAAEVRSRVLELSQDENARVRFQTAFSLGETNESRAAASLAGILRRDAGDARIRTAVLSSSLRHAAGMITALSRDGRFPESSDGQSVLRQLAMIVGGRNQPEEVRAVLSVVESAVGPQAANVQRTLTLGLGDGLRRSRSGLGPYLKSSPTAARILTALLNSAQNTLAGDSARTEQRIQAVQLLIHGDFKDVRPVLAGLLSPQQATDVQLEAVRTLAGFHTADVPAALLNSWPTLSPAVRAEIVETLLSRRDWIVPFLTAVKEGRVAGGSVPPLRRSQLLSDEKAEIRSLAEDVFAADQLSPRTEVLKQYQQALTVAGDAGRG
ncbi:MAG: hypothetical protein KDA89_01250, partial [Planctomycetaceae bacterium]|nr:hypothetical protein [Planctomycetaceae bacterium]